MNLGTLIDHEGRPAVRFQREYPHPVERVWAAVSEPDGLAHWFPSQVKIEPAVGGTVEFSGDPHLPPTTGTVLRYQPPTALAFTWADDELHFDLTPTFEGGCTLTLTNVLSARDTSARNAAGWTVCLAELDKHLEGRETSGPHSGDTEPWQPIYDAYVESGMPHGAVIPGA